MEIFHIITREKFTSGYVNFMKINFPQYIHYFALKADGLELNFVDDDNVLFYNTSEEFVFNNKLKNIVKKADKIIISGLFDENLIFTFFYYKKQIWNKIYLHFWGGDFYQFRGDAASQKRRLYFFEAVKNCGGVINLINEDYNELKKVFNISNEIPHYTAVMPGDPRVKIDFTKFRNREIGNCTLRILVGNSATIENCHLEAFNILAPLANEDIEILCPLSYGSNDYRELVIKKATEIFGEKFIPITQFYDFYDYIELLSTCTIGIFPNNRQQAMGNIGIMIELGKKIYMRSNTSMYRHYENLGIKIHTLEELGNDFYTIKSVSKIELQNNIECLEKYYSSFVEGWKNILDLKYKSWLQTNEFNILHKKEVHKIFFLRIKFSFKKIYRYVKRIFQL